MISFWTAFLGRKAGKTRIVPVTTKILLTFLALIVISSLATNYINLMLNRAELVKLMRELLHKDIREMLSFSSTQYEIFEFTHDKEASHAAIQSKAVSLLNNEHALFLAVSQTGDIVIQASRQKLPVQNLSSLPEWQTIVSAGQNKTGDISLHLGKLQYLVKFGYHPKWDLYYLRAEEKNEFYAEQRKIFRNISGIIFIITLFSAIAGAWMLHYILRYVGILTRSILSMAENNRLDVINMKGASNDDITFLGLAFNSLSTTVNNLLNIFRKFANQDVVIKAYRDREVKLEGIQRELTVLFSDIKGFTYITETLGTDIIKLLNLHYDRAIRDIINHNGLIGAIIGDALLAVYGALDDEKEVLAKNKSLEAVLSGYKIQKVAAELREEMEEKRKQMIRENGSLSEEEEKVFKAVMLEVGVGIDGGEVFYGTIGSYLRMTNTVIGDRVNSSSRLEGLTRIYKVPMIVSEYVRNDIIQDAPDSGIHFLELDTVQVKGKTTGTRIFWPLLKEMQTKKIMEETKLFGEGLEAYYAGSWSKAYRLFSKLTLPMAEEFRSRTRATKMPDNWNGIWEMKTK